MTIPREPARDAAEDELSKPAYHQDDPGLLQRILDWLWEHLGKLLNSAADASPGGVVGLAVILVAVLLLLLALWMRLGSPRPAPGGDRGSLFTDGPRSAAEHRAAAEAHAADSRWSEALQERMRAIVRSLEERALLDPRPGRTADEAATEAGLPLPGHAAALHAAARAFDEVTYAGRPTDAAGYARMRDLDEALLTARPDFGAATAPATTPAGAGPHGARR
ncbi:DUF4129 domain-containing protein [Streptomyces gossypii]|uniref:DUF4129 domain-containing protein n=1 Tax=Streptomyces gossypii TaxID=2883101 RepID=UPI0035CCE38E